MKYNGVEIGMPNINIIQNCINKRGLTIDADNVLSYIQESNGKKFKTLDDAIDELLSISKREDKKLKRRSKKKRIKFNRNMTYDEQVRHPLWEAFRLKVMSIRGSACEYCGSKEQIQIHHTEYDLRKMAWEYDISIMRVLCRDCHRKAHGIDLDEQMDLAILNDKY